jgi:hypothetical protein
MIKHLAPVCLGISAAAIAVSLLTSAPVISQQPKARQKWEYAVRHVPNGAEEGSLQVEGELGWEVVGSVPTAGGGGNQFYFKRPK